MTDPAAAPAAVAAPASAPRRRNRTGSLTRRLLAISAIWIGVLLLSGGLILERVLAQSNTDNFDRQLEYVLNAMIAASEIGPEGEVRFTRPPADQPATPSGPVPMTSSAAARSSAALLTLAQLSFATGSDRP